VSADLPRLQELLDRLEETRTRLDGIDDPDEAVEVLGELSELAKEVQAEIERARRRGPADAPGS
jgi:hypothetical protein